MKTKEIASVLRTAHRDGQMITLRTYSHSGLWVTGYIVGLSDEFVLLHYVDRRQVNLDGYLAIVRATLRSVRVQDDYDSLLHRALHAKGIPSLTPTNIALDDMPSLLSSIDAHFPLLSIDLVGKKSMYVGRVARLTKRSLSLRQIALSAHWSRVKKHSFVDITRVGFGAGYEDALWRVSEQNRRFAAPINTKPEENTPISENDQ